MVNITVKGKIPSKKNSKQIVCRGRFPMVLPSKAFKAWHDVALPELVAYREKTLMPDPRLPIAQCKVAIIMYAHDARAFDLTNKAESVMDLLVEGGIIEDDNCNVVNEVVLVFGGIDRVNPRAEITIV